MGTKSDSFISENSVSLRDALALLAGIRNGLAFWAVMCLGIVSTHMIGMSITQVAGILINWTVIAVAISILIATSLAFIILVIEILFIAIAQVNRMHLRATD